MTRRPGGSSAPIVAVVIGVLAALPPLAGGTGGPGGASWPAAASATELRGPGPQTGGPRIVRIDEGPLPVRAQRGLEGVARALATDRRAYAPLPGIGDPLSVLPSRPTVWVVRDLGRVPGPGPGERAERWAAGFADASRNLVAVRGGEGAAGRLPSLRRTFRHELAHLALTAATGGRAPRWLHEGYAQLVAGDWDWRQAWRLRWELAREGGDVLHNLSLAFAGRESEARTAYLLSYTAVHELWRRGGDVALGNFFAEMRRGASADVALRRVYGLTAHQFERVWTDSVKSRYGWLYMLSRASLFWLVLTVAVVVLGIRRWRYQKRRWEELRRQDAREERAGRGWRPEDYGARRPDDDPGRSERGSVDAGDGGGAGGLRR